MSKVMAILFFILLASPVLADQETLIPDGLGSPDTWAFNTTGKVADVTDGVDGQYIFEVTDEDDQRFTLSNTTLPSDATIDSFRVQWRAQDNGSGNNRVQVKVFSGSNSCDGINQALTTSFVNYQVPLLFTATGTGCDGSLTKTILDAMEVEFDCTSIGASRENRVTEVEVFVFFTPLATGAPQIIIID